MSASIKAASPLTPLAVQLGLTIFISEVILEEKNIQTLENCPCYGEYVKDNIKPLKTVIVCRKINKILFILSCGQN